MAGPIAVASPSAGDILYIPIDNRPVSLQLPQMLAEIAGIHLLTPPPALLGSYLQAGDAAAIGSWLTQSAPLSKSIVVSADMLGYGSLVASRLPGLHAAAAIGRLAPLAALRHTNPHSEIDVFGTVMRLAPTGVPLIGDAAGYFAAGDASLALTAFANLPSPATTQSDREVAATIRQELGPTLKSYLRARRRNVRVDSRLLDLVARGKIDRLVLGQDDAGPVGVHLHDIAMLRAHLAQLGLHDEQASIESGTDELGMVLSARALVHQLHWMPRIAVTYSRPGAQFVHDPIEYEPIDPTITKLIRLSGGARVACNEQPDINLFVYVAQTKSEERDAFIESLALLTRSHKHVTVADLSFINGTLLEQSELVQALIAKHLAASVDGYASWNTDANSVGTALAAAIFTQAGQRTYRYNALAHAAFLLDRYADDYAFRLLVRSRLTDVLHQEGLAQTYLLPGSAVRIESDTRSLLWQQVVALKDEIFPGLLLCRATVTLPWQRTFETELQLELQQKSQPVETQQHERRTCGSGVPSPPS